MNPDESVIDEREKLNKVGCEFIDSKLFDYAIECFDKILEKDPNDFVALYNKGFALDGKGNFKEANQYYTLTLENTDYKDTDALLNKGITHGQLNELDQAMECFDKLIELEPDNIIAWHNKGVAYQEMKEAKKAKKCFRKEKRLEKLKNIEKSEEAKPKRIKTMFGEIEDKKENREAAYLETCLTDDAKIRNAERALHSRLDTTQREKAWKWSAYYQSLVNGEDV
jgi:tetratricopeptide (TPR) repeat protein